MSKTSRNNYKRKKTRKFKLQYGGFTSSLDYSDKNLNVLPTLREGLTHLNCRNNQLIRLPDLPHTLVEINCGYNQLIKLPDLPVSLEKLDCYSNRLTILPEFPNRLEHVNCSNNPLVELPKLKNVGTLVLSFDQPHLLKMDIVNKNLLQSDIICEVVVVYVDDELDADTFMNYNKAWVNIKENDEFRRAFSIVFDLPERLKQRFQDIQNLYLLKSKIPEELVDYETKKYVGGTHRHALVTKNSKKRTKKNRKYRRK
jgi:hypothetical protein